MRSLVRIENNRVVYENPRDYSGVIDLEDLSHRTNYRVSELARLLGLSTRQLQRDFNDGLGVTPKYWLREQRMRHVYALVCDGFRLKQVAAMTGFRKYENFVNEVKAFYGVSPQKLSDFEQDSN